VRLKIIAKYKKCVSIVPHAVTECAACVKAKTICIYEQVLEQASRTYYHLCDDDYTIYSKVAVAKRSVIDTWSENFRLALDIFKEAVSESVLAITAALSRCSLPFASVQTRRLDVGK